jgi:UDP-N-acetylmuramyl pentapeptide synthase
LAAVLAGSPLQAAAEALRNAELPPMRMEIIPFQGATLVMDAYNASPPSVEAALETMRDIPCSGRRLAVLGEMKELGSLAEEAHRQVGRALAAAGLDKVMFYGLMTLFSMEEYLVAGASPSDLAFANSLDDVADFLRKAGEGDLVLIKGSRSLELEKALEKLEVHGWH